MATLTLTITNKTLYKTAYGKNDTISILPLNQISTLSGGIAPYYGESTITIISPDNVETTISNSPNGGGGGTFTFNGLGTYTLRYEGYNVLQEAGSGDFPISTHIDYSFYYTFAVVENHLPLKKWTMTDVINRTLDLAEPLRKGEKPRFRLNGMRADGTIITPENKQEGEQVGQAYKFDKILAPEPSYTKQTLRECLQEAGKIIHGEPILTPKKDENGWYYEVSYDMYASQDMSGIYTMPYIKKTVSQVIDSYAAYLDSNAENLVNQLDKYAGVIVEPYADGAKTVRTESMYARITDETMIIPTQFPVYSIEKLEYVYKADSGLIQSVDITPWLFERSVYSSQLSSYTEAYPYSKAYGLYYTQGGKNIEGLNFKVDAAAFPAFKNYAIVNILKQAIGQNYEVPEYPLMAFRVTYTPFYNARVAQTKSYYKEFIRPAALIYNQSSNVIESRYYGENLKGAIARIGNIELSLTYLLARLNDIPKAGQMYDQNYYISAVAVEYLPTCIKCTIGLSKDFNRLSAYIGINSEKRYSEVSQTQAVERNILYRNYVVIGNRETADTDSFIGSKMLELIAGAFTQTNVDYKPLTNAYAWGTSYQGNRLPPNKTVNLPVISSAFGNSISFSWKYADNYSAGGISVQVGEAIKVGENNVTGYFQNDATYTDYYGRLYYYNFSLAPSGNTENFNFQKRTLELPYSDALSFDNSYISTAAGTLPVEYTPYVLRKDNREALQVNCQIDFVTNLDNLIIGSALASYCPAVRGIDSRLKAKLYVFETELNKFTDHVEAFENVTLANMPSANISVSLAQLAAGQFSIDVPNGFPASGKSWAIITGQTKETIDVESEDGRETTETTFYGGDLLIGQNIEVTAGGAFTPIYFTKKREIFDKTVWKDRR